MNRQRFLPIGALLILMATTAVAAHQRNPQDLVSAVFLPFVTRLYEPHIISFQAVPDLADPGQTVTISWEVEFADQITLTRYWDYRPAEWWTDLPLIGTYSYTVPAWERNPVLFSLDAFSSATGTRDMAGVTISVICPDTWFFNPVPPGCPSPPLPSPAAEQPFENGFMIWLGVEDRIIVLFGDGQLPRVASYTDDWDGQPICDAGSPPAGLFQPIRGFGKVWCENQSVRARLGWAAALESSYETIFQRTTMVKYNHTYLRAADGNVWHLLPESSGWEKIIVIP